MARVQHPAQTQRLATPGFIRGLPSDVVAIVVRAASENTDGPLFPNGRSNSDLALLVEHRGLDPRTPCLPEMWYTLHLVLYRGIPRDPQLGSSSVQTPTLGWPSPEIVVTLVVKHRRRASHGDDTFGIVDSRQGHQRVLLSGARAG